MKRQSAMPESQLLTTMVDGEVSIEPTRFVPAGSVRRRLRVLPPAGGPIPSGAVLSSLRQCLHASALRSYGDTIERQLTACIGPQHWVLTNSGRSALSLVLMALRSRRPQCDEVIIPAYTSYSVPAAVVRAGLRVRLCDIEPRTLGLNPEALVRTMTDRTLCVVPHHLFGLPSRIREICNVATDARVPVVEDAAQGLGVSCEGQKAGMFGQASIFSVSRGKNIPGAGGGLIGLHDEALAAACRALLDNGTRNSTQTLGLNGAIETLLMAWFIRPSRYWLPASLPFLQLGASRFDPTFSVSPMTRFQQALLTYLLPNAPILQEGRQERALRLREALRGTKVDVLWPREEDKGAYLRLPVLIPTQHMKERLLGELNRRGLGSTGGYPLPLSKLPALRSFVSHPDQEYPVADGVSRRLITLPTHVWVTDRDIEETAEVVSQCVS
ncbi:MAG: DegT/DnrJ/EryC1/StrS aminotransferase family protein [Nitrospirales bacterium]